jgi:hypothetical protein
VFRNEDKGVQVRVWKVEDMEMERDIKLVGKKRHWDYSFKLGKKKKKG